MMPKPAAASDTARRLWAGAAGDARTPEEVAAAAEFMCTRLRLGLGRWIGAEGYRVLLDRALGLTRTQHPALGAVPCLGGDEPPATAAVKGRDSVEVADGLVALVTVLIELLARIVGADMAVQLVEQTRAGADERESESASRRGGRER